MFLLTHNPDTGIQSEHGIPFIDPKHVVLNMIILFMFSLNCKKIKSASMIRAQSYRLSSGRVSKEPEEQECQGQEPSPQEVSQGRQVRDGVTVWVFPSPPQTVHHPVSYAEQREHLQQHRCTGERKAVLKGKQGEGDERDEMKIERDEMKMKEMKEMKMKEMR